MNVLFYNRFKPDPHFGGIERVVFVISQALKSHNVNVFFAIPKISCSENLTNTFLLDSLNGKDTENKLTAYIQENNIQIIVSHYANDPYNNLFIKLKELYNLKFIVFYHFSPNCYKIISESSLQKPIGKENYKHRIKRYVKLMLKPLYIRYVLDTNNSNICHAYNHSDIYVLLSTRFKTEFLSCYNIKDNGDKIRSVWNSLSFNYFYDSDLLENKYKQVLIVARHEEVSKRILLALIIWSHIESLGISDWKLILVGEGNDTDLYKKYVQQHGLKHVIFVGKQNPEPYYKTASILMMTSSYEGFGLALTESQQMGVVPIAFDSYQSLHDIIVSGHNGIIVPNNDVQQYVDELIGLMRDDNKRTIMAIQGIESCKRFSVDMIVKQWLDILK